MAWPGSTISTTNCDSSSDDPAAFRSDAKDLIDDHNIIVNARGQASGVCDLDSSTKVPVARLYTGVANGVCDLDGSTKVPDARINKGVANSVCDLNSLGKIITTRLPLYTQFFADVQSTALTLSTAISEGLTTSIGPTGSGATYIWTSLNIFPANTTSIYLLGRAVIDDASAGMYSTSINVQENGDASTNRTLVYVSGYLDGTSYPVETYSSIIVPVDSSNIFQARWDSDATSPFCSLTILGYGV